MKTSYCKYNYYVTIITTTLIKRVKTIDLFCTNLTEAKKGLKKARKAYEREFPERLFVVVLGRTKLTYPPTTDYYFDNENRWITSTEFNELLLD